MNTWVGFRVQTTTASGAPITLADSTQLTVEPRNWAPPGTDSTLVKFDLTPVYDDSLQHVLEMPIVNDPSQPNGQRFPKGGFGIHHLNRTFQWRWTTIGPDSGWHT